MSSRVMTGKWQSPDVPKRDWSFVRLVDLRAHDRRAPTQICQMCEARHLRHVHEMRHNEWPEPLRVGFECAARMQGLPPEEIRRREAALKRKAARLEKWMRTGWLTTQKGDRGTITCTYKDQPPWRIELLTIGSLTCLQLRHLETGKVVVSKEARSAALAKEDAWDLWHEGEELRTDYLAELAEERRQQKAREEATLREEETARRTEWQQEHPDWDASERGWDDWLDWREQEIQREYDRRRVREPWPRSQRGNPKFKAQNYVFVALPPRPDEGQVFWKLWLKKPSWSQGRVVERLRFHSFEGVQQWVEQNIDKLPRRYPCPWEGIGEPADDATVAP